MTVAHALPYSHSVDFDDVEVRKKTAKLLMRLFEHWKLDNQQKLALLGMSENSRSQLAKFAAGTAPLSKGRDTQDRAAHLLSMHKSLGMLYPFNPDLRYSWILRRNELLDGKRPIDIMIEEGLLGILKMARFLEMLRSS